MKLVKDIDAPTYKAVRTAADLAINGAPPMFAEPLHVGRPNIGNHKRFLQRASDILDSGWLSNNGPIAQEFEQRIASFLGVKHCVAMCNGTIALEIATRALDLKGEVIVPSYTFVATAHALQWQEITPIFADIDPATHNLDPAAVWRMITPRTTGIIGVHLWGRASPVKELEAIAKEHNLRLMFDASHGFGCSLGGRLLGGFGECEVFSFHATKFFNTFEGGAVVTNNDTLAEKMRLMRNFGFSGYDNVIYPGTNGKMTEIAAAMGLTNLEELDDFVAINRRNYQCYRDGDRHDSRPERAPVRRVGAEQLPVRRCRSCAIFPGLPRSNRRGAARGKHTSAKVLLARVPQHGALSFVLPACGPDAPEHHSRGGARRRPADRVGDAR